MPSSPDEALAIGEREYQTLAAFRHSLRQFLAFSEASARSAGLTPQQHQAILAIRAAGSGGVSISHVASQLVIRHHTAVELVDRLIKAGIVEKTGASDDRRKVVLTLTPKAGKILEDLSAAHIRELRLLNPRLKGLLDEVAMWQE